MMLLEDVEGLIGHDQAWKIAENGLAEKKRGGPETQSTVHHRLSWFVALRRYRLRAFQSQGPLRSAWSCPVPLGVL